MHSFVIQIGESYPCKSHSYRSGSIRADLYLLLAHRTVVKRHKRRYDVQLNNGTKCSVLCWLFGDKHKRDVVRMYLADDPWTVVEDKQELCTRCGHKTTFCFKEGNVDYRQLFQHRLSCNAYQ